MNDFELKNEEKVLLADQIALRYYDHNFGTMLKADIDTLIFSVYIEHCLNNGLPYDDYTLSIQLGITEAKVRTLKERKQLQYPYKGYNWKKEFVRIIPNAKYNDVKKLVQLNIGDVNLLKDVRNFVYSYRCKHNKSLCSNKEIQQAAVENYVLNLLERYIFDDRNIPVILKGVTDFYTEKNYHNIEERRRLDNVIRGDRRKLDNIKKAVMNGLLEADFAENIAELNANISRLEEEKNSLPVTKTPPEITEEMLRAVIHTFADRVRARNREDCKRFIKDFVDSVIVYEDKIEVNLKISSEIEGYRINRTLNRQFLPTVTEQK